MSEVGCGGCAPDGGHGNSCPVKAIKEASTGNSELLCVGGKYNFKLQDERLIYLGKVGAWNQFAETTDPQEVWAEVLDSDLWMIEETSDS